MGAGDLFLFIDIGRDALDGPAVVGEHDGRTMFTNLIAEQSINGRPDRFFRQRPELLDGVDDAQVEIFTQPGVHDRHGTRLPFALGVRFAAAEVAGHFFQRTLCRRQADAHERFVVGTSQRRQSFQEQSEEHAALVGAEGVNFIDDAMRDTPQRLTGARGQQQMQRFGRGDEDVRRPANETLPFGCRSISGANGGLQ